jgi:lysophospholipase L1-like esterase
MDQQSALIHQVSMVASDIRLPPHIRACCFAPRHSNDHQQIRANQLWEKKTMNISLTVSRLIPLFALCFVTAAGAEERGDALVLGDSIAFGYIASVGYEYFYTDPENFIGFADDLGHRFRLDVVNASCPGETTGSFLSSTAPDNGCRAYRGLYPLHAGYRSTQLQFAKTYLTRHREVRLVTITLGANDGFLLEASCASNPTPVLVAECIEAGAPALLAKVAENIEIILSGLRATGYAGAVVVMNYYSLDYTDATGTGITQALNAAIAAPTTAYGAVIADVFTAFKTVASKTAFGGKTCNTGLLNPDVSHPFVCNDHPALTGHRLIARTIADALRESY